MLPTRCRAGWALVSMNAVAQVTTEYPGTNRNVHCVRAATLIDLCRMFGLAPDQVSRFDGPWCDGSQTEQGFLKWPLAFVGELLTGEMVVGETVRRAECKIVFRPLDNLRIITPVTLYGRLRERTDP